jgi:hypothetical protein
MFNPSCSAERVPFLQTLFTAQVLPFSPWLIYRALIADKVQPAVTNGPETFCNTPVLHLPADSATLRAADVRPGTPVARLSY